jgi:hypothetical protein
MVENIERTTTIEDFQQKDAHHYRKEASFRNTIWTSDRFMSLEVCSYVEMRRVEKLFTIFVEEIMNCIPT